MVIFSRLEHPTNKPSPKEVKLAGIVMLVSEVQLENAESPIEVTLSGRVMLVSEVQPSYLQPVITQYFASNKSEIWS